MTDTSPRLDLPYLMPSQAQKHVTVNESLLRLDSLVQLALTSTGAETPPVSPATGEVHALGASPTGDWSGRAGQLAMWDGTAWHFIPPSEGWLAYDITGAQLMTHSAGDWTPQVDQLTNLSGVGIGASYDATNKLSVAAAATLLSHDGNGHQLKINKAAAGDTASLLFQSNWTGHAEMGLAGDTAFGIKVSDDGNSWIEAMRLDPAAGTIALAPAGTVRATLSDTGFAVNVPVTGTAVMSSSQDTTTGRLMAVGAFGLGGEDLAGVLVSDAHDALPSGFYGGTGAGASNYPDSETAAQPFLALNRRSGAGSWQAMRVFFRDDATPVVRGSADSGATWPNETTLFGTANLLDTVGLSGGTPTGGVIEYGTGSEGDYVRFADGTQICTESRSVSVTTSAAGALHVDDSSCGSWTFAAGFAAAPVVHVQVQGTRVWANAHAAGTTSVPNVSIFSTQSESATSMTVVLTAIGRWA